MKLSCKRSPSIRRSTGDQSATELRSAADIVRNKSDTIANYSQTCGFSVFDPSSTVRLSCYYNYRTNIFVDKSLSGLTEKNTVC